MAALVWIVAGCPQSKPDSARLTWREGAIEERSFAEWSMGYVSLDAQLRALLAKRHALTSNGSLIDDASAVRPLLDAFRSGQLRTYFR